MKKTLLCGLCILTIIMLIPWFFCYNLTPSVPRGFYVRDFSALRIKSYVRFHTTDHYRYPWLHTGWLLKQICALPGDYVVVSENGFFVNRQYVGAVLKTDSTGNMLPVYNFKGVVPAGFIFVSGCGNSFDSRYFGAVSIKKVMQFKKLF